MSFMKIQPDMLAAADGDLSLIGSAVSADNAAAVHSKFVSTLGASATSYAAAEAANAITVR
jgi:hypothetical protein